MSSREETLLNALINGETVDFKPQSRVEKYLKHCINKNESDEIPKPISRVDALLCQLIDVVGKGGESQVAVYGSTEAYVSGGTCVVTSEPYE